MILEKGKHNFVSLRASENPNCPPMARIKLMMQIGKIGKEDPTKHIIEREEVKEDPDLQKLRDLIASSNSSSVYLLFPLKSFSKIDIANLL
jgi:hypothetical protein